jgi:hypothetical protein
VEVAIVEIAAGLIEQPIEQRRLTRDVDVAPADEIRGLPLLDDHAITG